MAVRKTTRGKILDEARRMTRELEIPLDLALTIILIEELRKRQVKRTGGQE